MRNLGCGVEDGYSTSFEKAAAFVSEDITFVYVHNDVWRLWTCEGMIFGHPLGTKLKVRPRLPCPPSPPGPMLRPDCADVRLKHVRS